MKTENFLVEIGTEELPPKSLKKLAEAFRNNVEEGLNKAELTFESIQWYAAPRRLALNVTALSEAQADKVVEKRGPAITAAFDQDGNPTKAAAGWARSNGITVEQAQRLETDKGAWLLHKAEVKGKDVDALIPDIIISALAKLPIPKAMKWGAFTTQFIRPVHTITMLFGDRVISGEILGKQSAQTLRGHRFHSSQDVTLTHADNYLTALKDAYVMADFAERQAVITQQVEAVAAKLGGVAQVEQDLLDEVTSLVEWPVTLSGDFEAKFLNVPAEALIYTMKDDQKYFPVFDNDGNLMPKFIFVSNIESKDPSQVISGNEKVIRPRLADAEFFFETDKKKTLASRLNSLDTVLFQKQLGTLKDKSERIASLAGFIAEKIGANVAHSERAGLLSKTDLMTEMVMEFTEVQGVMGMHYAKHDGEPECVANAMNEQYMPRFAGDHLPQSLESCAVALADKFDSLAGIFGIGQQPKSDKDPFALRRAAIGALRILVEKEIDLDIIELTEKAVSLFGDKLTNDNTVQEVADFMLGRFRTWYQDEGISVDVIQAVLARRPTKPLDFDKRVKAVEFFRSLAASDSLAAANKRVGNILAKFDGEVPSSIDNTLLVEPAEKTLAENVIAKSAALEPVFADKDYQKALAELAELRQVVDDFFDNVMVMADDEAVKLNRLAILAQLRAMFMRVADISLLQS
ncbi:glycine--tRNA ligase subunit beta [Flocculibacter collagenilyticus]|uniref:glycine--tRNA ligase subunit beta n=1 Tax=Flocculibacter collagenilyticus TaxID=2744479 RepID=UPI0018F5B748|nr:glycine--tRNA ligase subunit beta [Flocculibacter collagenilyticus]